MRVDIHRIVLATIAPLEMGDMVIVDRGDLGVDFNPKGSPDKHTFVNDKGADALADWLLKRRESSQIDLYRIAVLGETVPFHWTEKSHGHWQAEFSINSPEAGRVEYDVIFDITHNFTDVSFVAYSENKQEMSSELTGWGNALKVFSTVLAAIRYFIQENQGERHAQRIEFAAAVDEPSRVSLYRRLANKFLPPGWNIREERSHHFRRFILTAPEHGQVPVAKHSTQIGSSPYEMWQSSAPNFRVRLLEKLGLDPKIAVMDWQQIPARTRLTLKRYLEGETSSAQYDSPLRFAPDVQPTRQFIDPITRGYV